MFSYTLNAVKSLQNYGIFLRGGTTDPAFTQGFLYSSPNVSIVGSSCFIDYSNTTNLSDQTYIKKVFGTSPAGTTYSLSSGDYYDEFKNVRTDISGVFSKITTLNDNKLIVGEIVSGFTYTTNYSYYSRFNFISPPQYTTAYTGGSTASNYIVNSITSNPEKSFLNAGPIGSCFGKEEYVQISSSSLNTGKLKINSVMKLKDNREVLYTDTVLTTENLGSTASTCTFYLRGNAEPNILNVSRKTLGCYVTFDEDGNQVSCYENQNRLQAYLRTQSEPDDYVSYWVPCLDCSRLTDTGLNAATSDRSLIFDSTIFFFVTEQPVATINNASEYVITYTYTLYSNAAGNDSIAATYDVTFDINDGFKIDLSHPSLKNFTVNAYSDSTKNVLMTQNIYKIGNPGYDQSSLIYQKSATSPKLIYLEFTGPTVFNVTVTVL